MPSSSSPTPIPEPSKVDPAPEQPPLSDEERAHLREFLVTAYELKEDFVATLSDAQIRALVKSKQIEKIKVKKNPNSFWIIKGLPAPELPEPKGPKRHGLYIFLGFIFALVVFVVVLTTLLLVKH